MKSNLFLAAIAMLFFLANSLSQGSGKVNLRADILTTNDKQDMQISIVDLASHDLVNRQDVSNRYYYSLPLSGRYMLYFKKEGHPTARLIVDTNAPESLGYNIHFQLNLRDLEPSMETGISISAGSIGMNAATGNFVLTAPESGKANLCAVTFQSIAEGPAQF